MAISIGTSSNAKISQSSCHTLGCSPSSSNFLKPWFLKTCQKDLDIAVSSVCTADSGLGLAESSIGSDGVLQGACTHSHQAAFLLTAATKAAWSQNCLVSPIQRLVAGSMSRVEVHARFCVHSADGKENSSMKCKTPKKRRVQTIHLTIQKSKHATDNPKSLQMCLIMSYVCRHTRCCDASRAELHHQADLQKQQTSPCSL